MGDRDTTSMAGAAPQLALPSSRGLFYGGAFHSAIDGAAVETTNPATGESLGEVAWAGPQDVDAAVATAQAGFRIWRETAPAARAQALRAAADTIAAHAEDLAMIDAADCGNPVRSLLADARISIDFLHYFAGLAASLGGSTMAGTSGSFNFTRREPLGVVARLNAFNHPFMFAVARMAAPLAAGNAVIVKSPAQAPLSSLRLAELLGPLFPPGVFNVLSGGRECGEALVRHPGVAKVGLIGSVATGKAIMAAGASTLKKLSLELGGKNPLIVYPDADLDAAADGIVAGMNFAWCGQSCGSTSRVLLHETVYHAMLDRVVAKVEAIRPGIPTRMETAMGCLVDQAQCDRVMGYVARGKEQGAHLVAGGSRPEDPELAAGHFVLPTVFAEVEPGMAIAREEIFGPVLSLMKWSDEEEMFRIANGLEYGLTASVWTRDLDRALSAVERIEAGYVWINNSSSHFIGSPFGGYKQSGLGREESIEELQDCTQIKHVNVRLGAARPA